MNRGFRLEKNTIVKFGRVRYRVRDIDYSDKDSNINQLGDNGSIQKKGKSGIAST